jgi:hypothetical protein
MLSWDFESFARGFDIYRSIELSGTYTKVNDNPIFDLNYYDGQESIPLSADTEYYYKIKALGQYSISGSYDSPFSEIVKGVTLSIAEVNSPTYYYPETIRNVTVSVLGMFDKFIIKRYDKSPTKSANVIKTIKVPITFGPSEKRQLEEIRGSQKGWQALPVPRMALFLNGIDYDSSRASGVNEIRHFYNTNLELSDLDSFFTDAQPAPYNFNFTLSIRTDSLSDFSQIVENIFPYFNPSRYIRVKEFNFLNIERDLPIIMAPFTTNFTEPQEVNDDRRIDADIPLTIQGWMYRPISSEKLIKIINTNYFFINND